MSIVDTKEEREYPQQHHHHYLQESKEQGLAMSSSASTQAIASIGSYCLANMAMTVTNKYVFSVCDFLAKLIFPTVSFFIYFVAFVLIYVCVYRVQNSIFTVCLKADMPIFNANIVGNSVIIGLTIVCMSS